MQIPIRVLLVDDNLDFIRSAIHFLSLQPSLQVVGSVISGKDALEEIPHLKPDLVLMDWAMPEMSGLEATRQIKACNNTLRIVILTLYDIPQYRKAAQSAGADGFICKGVWSEQLIPFLQHIFNESDLLANMNDEQNLKIQNPKNPKFIKSHFSRGQA
jgi:DNA-binding NarL/FixJ family response regulator